MQQSSIRTALCTLLFGVAAFSTNAQALDQGDWIFRIGASYVAPNDDSGTVNNPAPIAGTGVEVDDATSLSLTIGYMATENLGFEVLGAWPFQHNIGPNSGLGAALGSNSDIGSTRHLPPVFSVQWHFMPHSNVRPYVGVGVNYTHFFDEHLRGNIVSVGGYDSLELDDSWGAAGQVGVDIDLGSSDTFLNLDVRYIDIGTKATIKEALPGSGAFGPKLTTDVDIDPWVYTISIGTTF